ncbi:hypothetical protein PSC71_05925 [Devosia sp. J2-20]|nr:hypothetical protein [Devosia sp. J2-20]WDR00310.1 hypothetical protein PSC71_05925 [Devosia sp. J2-20]
MNELSLATPAEPGQSIVSARGLRKSFGKKKSCTGWTSIFQPGVSMA